jgi:hypothetical protein
MKEKKTADGVRIRVFETDYPDDPKASMGAFHEELRREEEFEKRKTELRGALRTVAKGLAEANRAERYWQMGKVIGDFFVSMKLERERGKEGDSKFTRKTSVLKILDELLDLADGDRMSTQWAIYEFHILEPKISEVDLSVPWKYWYELLRIRSEANTLDANECRRLRRELVGAVKGGALTLPQLREAVTETNRARMVSVPGGAPPANEEAQGSPGAAGGGRKG